MIPSLTGVAASLLSGPAGTGSDGEPAPPQSPTPPQERPEPKTPKTAFQRVSRLFTRTSRDLIREIREDRKEWLALLRFLKDRGKDLHYLHGVFLTDSSLLDEEWMIFGLPDIHAGSVFGIRPEDLDPARYLKEQAATFLEKDDGLRLPREKGAAVNVNPVTLHVAVSGDTLSIVLWNWFEPEPFFAKDFRLSEALQDNTLHPNLISIVDVTIAAHLKSFDFDEALESLAPLSPEESEDWNRRIVYGAERPEGWSQSDLRTARRSWRRLLRPMKSAGLDARALGENIDRGDGRHILLHDGTALEATRQRMRRNRFEPVEVHGILDGIFLTTRGRVRSYRLARDPDARQKSESWQQDRYGNVILPVSGPDVRNGRQRVVGFQVIPRLPFGKSPKGGGSTVTLGVDLSRFGLKDYPNLLTVPVLSPAIASDHEHPYALYSTLPSKPGETHWNAVNAVASEVERSFGFEPGEKIENVFFVPSLHENASVQAANPETLFFWEEILPSLICGDGDHVVRHEAYHSLDLQHGFSLHPEFRGFYERLIKSEDTELFDAINETRFLDQTGGHSADDPLEFFASLVNTLQAPKWEEKAGEMSPRVRGLYYHALQALRTALAAKHPDIKAAPIYAALKDRIQSLEKMEGSAYAPLVRLVLTPIPELFRQGTPAAEPIESWDFRKVLRSRRPVAVFVYGHREDATRHLPNANLSERIGSARLLAMNIDDVGEWSRHFGGTVGSGKIYFFRNGRLTGSLDVIEESLKYERGTSREKRSRDLVGKE